MFVQMEVEGRLTHIRSAGICCILKARRDGRAQGGRLYLIQGPRDPR